MYISIKDSFRIIKKEVGKSNLGRTIYRDVLEVTCDKCSHCYETDIALDFDGKVKISCPFCDK